MAKLDTAARYETPDLVAASVERHRAHIAQQVVQHLCCAGSRLTRDPATQDQLRAQVSQVLDDAVAIMRGDPPGSAGQRPDTTSIEIGQLCARYGIHPAESVRAESALFETALLAVAPDLHQAPQPADGVAQFCLALQRSIAGRAELIGRSHFTRLLDQVHHTHAQQRLQLSRELHDHAAHTTVVALRDLELYEIYQVADQERARTRLSAAKAHLQEAVETIRALSSRLRRTDASEGLQPALVRYLASAPPGVTTSVTVTGDESVLPLPVGDELFLVLREATGNALRHADPRTVRVELLVGADRVAATVTDDGRGFDTERARSAPRGTGLASMAERAYATGGSLQLDSRPGHGTTVRVEIPLPRRPT